MLSKINVLKKFKELTLLEIKFNQMVKARDILLRSVNHELRAPLSRLKLDVELVKDEKVRDSINKEIDFIEDLLNELMEIEKVHVQTHEFKEIAVADVISDVVERASGEFKGLKLELSKDSMVVGNTKLLMTLFKNLIENAYKYKSADGEVTVRTSKKNSFIEVLIINQGPEISAEELPSIFEPFFRSEKNVDVKKKKGHGLGLSLCNEIVKIHKGKINVSSKAGLGTIFKVTLPSKL